MSVSSVLCIGLDAACAKQVDPLIEDGVMPNLESLRARGASGPLTTTTPPWTPSAWPSITTGTTPWTHGIYDFYDHTTDEPHLVSARDLQVPYLWEYLDQAGLEPIVVNVPVTNPVSRLSGSLVPGYLAPEDCRILVDGDPAAQSELDDDYRIYARKTDGREATIQENESLIDLRVSAAETLADRQDWSFMMVQFQRTDSIFHTMGHDDEAVRRVYSRVDDAIGSLLEFVDDDTAVVVVSDHGIHEYEQIFRCNTWLRDQGWLQTSPDAERHSWGETTKPTGENTDEDPTLARRVLGTSLDALGRVGITPRRAERALAVVGLADPVRRRLPADLLLGAAEHVDWESSRAYCRSVSSLGIRCNVAGRDPGGIVPESEFPAVRESLIDALESVTAPDGTPVFATVYDRHERHGGKIPNEASAPDIVVEPNEMTWKITDVVRDPVFAATDEFSHTYKGLCIVASPSIDPNTAFEPNAPDVAPIILGLLGYRPPPVMEGSIPPTIGVSMEDLSETPSPDERTYHTDEQLGSTETVTDRLEQLGYLE